MNKRNRESPFSLPHFLINDTYFKMANSRSQRATGNTGTDKESKPKSTSSRTSKAAAAAAAAATAAAAQTDSYDYTSTTGTGGGATGTTTTTTSGTGGGNQSNSNTTLPATTKDLVNIDSLPVQTLRKYRQVHKLGAAIPSAVSYNGYLLNSAVGHKTLSAKNTNRVTKHELASVVKKHFAQQNPRESEVIVDFIYSVNRQGELLIGGFVISVGSN